MTPAPLGSLVVITDRHAAALAGHDLIDVVREAVDAGAPTVLLRDKDLPDRRPLAMALRTLTAATGARLVIGSDADLATAVEADGVHLAARDPLPPSGCARWGRSCHNHHELAEAYAVGATWATISPVYPSVSKPDYGPAIGESGLTDLTSATEVPLYALGGITPTNAAAALTTGAVGVAVLHHVMTAADPARAVRDLLAALTAVTA